MSVPNTWLSNGQMSKYPAAVPASRYMVNEFLVVIMSSATDFGTGGLVHGSMRSRVMLGGSLLQMRG